MSKHIRSRWTAGMVALTVGVLSGALLESTVLTEHRAFAAEGDDASHVEAVARPASGAAELSDVFADLAEATIPAVVQIQVRLSPTSAGDRGGIEMLPEQFRRFFGEPGRPLQEAPRMAGGSGFLVSPDGYIVTNNHVVGEAQDIRVVLADQRSFEAELVGTDPTTDIAVIKIASKDLPYLRWGDSSDLRVGSWVIAVGNPGVGSGQLESTVTNGIVSAKGRPLQLIAEDLRGDPRYGSELAGYAIENFIQTDAVINPGNSGGPMVDLSGRVVGMNTAIASTDGYYQGYGFAIPADLVRRVASDLMEDGAVQRPWLGVQVAAVSPEDAEAFHLPSVAGVLVQAVTPDSPAEDAGLRQGDVIVTVDGTSVLSGGALQERVAELEPGDEAQIGYYRDGSERSVDIRLGENPGLEGRAGNIRHDASAVPAAGHSLGIDVAPLDARTARELGFEQEGGVVISDVDPMGPAASRGLTRGLRIETIDGHQIRNPDDVADALSEVDAGEVVTLIVSAPTTGSRIVNLRAR